MTDTSTKSESQQRKILHHLTNSSIDPIHALDKYGRMRLGARIWDLRKRGLNIKTEKIKFTNQNGHAGMYAKYVLICSAN